MKRVRQFSELSEKERFKLKKKLLKRSYREGRWLLNNVRCVRPSSEERLVRFSDLSEEEKKRLEEQRKKRMKRENRDLLEDVICIGKF